MRWQSGDFRSKRVMKREDEGLRVTAVNPAQKSHQSETSTQRSRHSAALLALEAKQVHPQAGVRAGGQESQMQATTTHTKPELRRKRNENRKKK